MYADDNRFIKISEDEADKLNNDGVAVMYDMPSIQCGGFFPAQEDSRKDIILILTDEGSFIRAAEDLVRSDDGVFVGFVENGKPPEFEDMFDVFKL